MTAKYNICFLLKLMTFCCLHKSLTFHPYFCKINMFVLVLEHLMDYVAMICVLILNVRVYKVSSINLVVNQISKE